jgi:hypothetical protein
VRQKAHSHPKPSETRQGWGGGKDHGVYTSRIQFNVVRRECDVSVDHFER